MQVGLVNYINALPYYFPLKEHFTIKMQEPTALNQAFLKGRLDTALCSSLVAMQGHVTVVPGFGIAAQKAILSVLLYTKVPVTDLTDKPVALDRASATSNALFKILCAHHWNIRPLLVTKHLPHVARIVIGDPALMLPEDPTFWKIDLATAWYEMTGHPFVFAHFVTHTQKEIPAFLKEVDLGLQWSQKHLDHIIHAAHKKTKLPISLLHLYYSLCTYRLGEKEMKGFNLFKHYVSSSKTQHD